MAWARHSVAGHRPSSHCVVSPLSTMPFPLPLSLPPPYLPSFFRLYPPPIPSFPCSPAYSCVCAFVFTPRVCAFVFTPHGQEVVGCTKMGDILLEKLLEAHAESTVAA